MFEKKAISLVDLTDVIARRYSGRAFDPERRVERHALLALLEAARWAPSCFGDEPWRYIVWDRFDDHGGWQRAFECLAAGNQSWAGNAPLLMAAIADSLFERNAKQNRWGAYDTGAASVCLALQATAMRLMVHQMGGFDASKLQTALRVPERYTCLAMIAVGYQLPEERIPAELKEREHAPRARKPIGERFFQGAWGNAVKTE
ncbi:MAG: nitroreductase family protein [Gammaproteobacteria bacterium]